MLLSALITSLPGAELRGPDAEVTGITFDSRQVRPGYLFVCLRGQRFDGHDFAGAAAAGGAAGLIVERFVNSPLTQVMTPDTRLALASVAKTFFDKPDEQLGLVGVTGTNGKTTTVALIAWMLRQSGLRVGDVTTAAISIDKATWSNPEHQTTPSAPELQALLRQMRQAGVQWAVIETTSHGLAQHRVAGFAFNRAVFTRITHEHLEYHGTMAAYVEAKARLLDLVADAQAGAWGKMAILNRDDPHFEPLRGRTRTPVLTYGRSEGSDIRVVREAVTATGLEFEAVTPWGDLAADSTLPGSFNVENCLAAAACAGSIGVSMGTAAEAIRTFPGVKGRMQRIRCGQPFTVIVDFAHTPDSLTLVLETLRKQPGRLLVAFGSAGERDIQKRPMMGAVAARLADHFIITNEDPRGEDPSTIAEAIAAGARTESRSASFEIVLDRRQAIAKLLGMAQSGDTVLLAGKGHESSIILAGGQIPWDEAQVARELLAGMGYQKS